MFRFFRNLRPLNKLKQSVKSIYVKTYYKLTKEYTPFYISNAYIQLKTELKRTRLYRINKGSLQTKCLQRS